MKKENKDSDKIFKDNAKNAEEVVLSRKEYDELILKAKEKDSFEDKYLRLYAEYENSKKIWDRNRTELLKFGNFRILKEFVVILDEIEAALLSLSQHNQSTVHTEGLNLIYKKIKEALFKEGLKTIEAAGKKFDPHLHEALFFEEREDLDEHMIIEVIQQGYVYEDKVLRPAKVKVSVKPKQTQDLSLKTQDQKEETSEGHPFDSAQGKQDTKSQEQEEEIKRERRNEF